MKIKLLHVLTLIAGLIMVLSFTVSDAGDPWPVPDKYKNMKNPVKADKASLDAGAALWVKHCQSRHGKKGLGDGTKAAQLDTHPGDFTDKAVQSQTDGSLFYKTTEGRGDMPSFKKKIPDQEDIWNLVNHMRKLDK
jgi:mono/diheme cytochrome c family protein